MKVLHNKISYLACVRWVRCKLNQKHIREKNFFQEMVYAINERRPSRWLRYWLCGRSLAKSDRTRNDKWTKTIVMTVSLLIVWTTFGKWRSIDKRYMNKNHLVSSLCDFNSVKSFMKECRRNVFVMNKMSEIGRKIRSIKCTVLIGPIGSTFASPVPTRVREWYSVPLPNHALNSAV